MLTVGRRTRFWQKNDQSLDAYLPLTTPNQFHNQQNWTKTGVGWGRAPQKSEAPWLHLPLSHWSSGPQGGGGPWAKRSQQAGSPQVAINQSEELAPTKGKEGSNQRLWNSAPEGAKSEADINRAKQLSAQHRWFQNGRAFGPGLLAPGWTRRG